jgi:hypothetical protein
VRFGRQGKRVDFGPGRFHGHGAQHFGVKVEENMTVYLVILEDRHTDVSVDVYADKERAIQAAEQIRDSYEYTPEEPDEDIDGWLFNATLSTEGDCIRVEEAEVIER